MADTIKLKRGPLSNADKDFINKVKGRMSAEQMAAQRRRPVSVVENYLATLAPEAQARSIDGERAIKMGDSLRLRPEWKQFEQQFTPEELEYFEYKFVQFMTDQFADIYPTEEMQLFHVITLDILAQRALKEQKFIMSEMARIERLIQEEEELLDEEEGQGEEDRLRGLKGEYDKYRASMKLMAQRNESYLMRQSVMLRELKGTRDQRIKVLEGSQHSFLGYLRYLQDEEFREKVGRDMELMRVATEKQQEKLSAPHEYVDGVVDYPLLTPELVMKLDEAEELEKAELERLEEMDTEIKAAKPKRKK